MTEISLENIDIHKIFNDFLKFLNDSDIEITKAQTSIYALLIDIFGAAKLIDFFNQYNNKYWRINAYTIRVLSIIIHEAVEYLIKEDYINRSDFVEPNDYNQVIELRNKIHQFEKKKFAKNIKKIEDHMGRSHERMTPMLDTLIDYIVIDKKAEFLGTNIWSYYLTNNMNIQENVYLMQRIIRSIQSRVNIVNDNLFFKKIITAYKIKRYSYCYTDILSDAKIVSLKMIDRLLMAYDESSALLALIKYTISIDDYLLGQPYLIYFLVKLTSITYDETMDNIENFIKFTNNNSDRIRVSKIIKNINSINREKAKCIRNNLHYSRQEKVALGNESDILVLLYTLIEEIHMIMISIKEVLNINPSKRRLRFYNFLRWAQEK